MVCPPIYRIFAGSFTKDTDQRRILAAAVAEYDARRTAFLKHLPDKRHAAFKFLFNNLARSVIPCLRLQWML